MRDRQGQPQRRTESPAVIRYSIGRHRGGGSIQLVPLASRHILRAHSMCMRYAYLFRSNTLQ
jgi:hypothetical protein